MLTKELTVNIINYSMILYLSLRLIAFILSRAIEKKKAKKEDVQPSIKGTINTIDNTSIVIVLGIIIVVTIKTIIILCEKTGNVSLSFIQYSNGLLASAIAYVCFKLSAYLIKESAGFGRRKKTSKAEVVGYGEAYSYSNARGVGERSFEGYRLRLKIFDLEDKYDYIATKTIYAFKSPPVGTILEVEYKRWLFGYIVYLKGDCDKVMISYSKGFDFFAKIIFLLVLFCFFGLLKS